MNQYKLFCNICNDWKLINLIDSKIDEKADFEMTINVECDHNIKIIGHDESWKALNQIVGDQKSAT